MPIDMDRKRKRQREWKAKRRADWLADKFCVFPVDGGVCGTKVNLEIDHINPADKVDHRIWSWRMERILAELTKCQVLCYSHHKIKSSTNGDYSFRG